MLAILDETAVKRRLQEHGLTVPDGEVVFDVATAVRAGFRIGFPVVVKAVVAVAGRAEKGLVAFALDPPALESAADRILGTMVAETGGAPVTAIRVEAAAPPGEEHYLACTFDFRDGTPVLLHGPGGSGIEDGPEPCMRPIPPNGQVDLAQVPAALHDVVTALVRVFRETQARLVELNPVRLVDGSPMVLDAKATLDPYCALPHDGVVVGRPASDAERRLRERLAAAGDKTTVRFERLDGDVGVVMWGGGSTMLALDAMFRRGLRPANYSDIAAGADLGPVIAALTTVVLDDRPNALFVGSTVSSTLSAFELARSLTGVLRAHPGNRPDLPVAVRLAGRDEAEATRCLSEFGNVRHFDRTTTIEDAVGWLDCAIRERRGHPA